MLFYLPSQVNPRCPTYPEITPGVHLDLDKGGPSLINSAGGGEGGLNVEVEDER